MKRKALCAFALIFWLLAVCTLLSLRIEEWMTPIVTVTEPVRPPGSSEDRLPLDCLFDGVLYQTYEGGGWERGTRVSVVRPEMYEVLPDFIKMSWGKVVRYATKTPRPGEIVTVLGKQELQDDLWLAVPADGKALPALGETDESVTVADSASAALLLKAENLPQPFMEKRAVGMVPVVPAEDDFSPWTGADGEIDWDAVDWDAVMDARPKAPRIYSLNELAALAGQLPKLGLLAAAVLFGLCLWGRCCALSRRAGENRAALTVNIGLALFLLAGIFLLLRKIDLPSSLLPVNNILEISHYRREFEEIFSGLALFSEQGNAAAGDALRSFRRQLSLSAAIIPAGAVPVAAAAIIRRLNSLRNHRLRSRHGKHARRTNRDFSDTP